VIVEAKNASSRLCSAGDMEALNPRAAYASCSSAGGGGGVKNAIREK
jgi:hypothetical protein